MLALSPFTAPFSTCDLSTLTNSDAGHARAARLSPLRETLVDELLGPLPSPEGPVAGRTRFLVTACSQSTALKFVTLDTGQIVWRTARCRTVAYSPGMS